LNLNLIEGFKTTSMIMGGDLLVAGIISGAHFKMGAEDRWNVLLACLPFSNSKCKGITTEKSLQQVI
jgi:hypothetical protein